MTNQDLQAIEMLSHRLESVAAELRRAVTLLRTGGELERAEARLSALVATAAAAAVGAPPLPITPARPIAIEIADRASGAHAVFDPATLARREFATMSAGQPARLLQGASKIARARDEIPF